MSECGCVHMIVFRSESGMMFLYKGCVSVSVWGVCRGVVYVSLSLSPQVPCSLRALAVMELHKTLSFAILIVHRCLCPR